MAIPPDNDQNKPDPSKPERNLASPATTRPPASATDKYKPAAGRPVDTNRPLSPDNLADRAKGTAGNVAGAAAAGGTAATNAAQELKDSITRNASASKPPPIRPDQIPPQVPAPGVPGQRTTTHGAVPPSGSVPATRTTRPRGEVPPRRTTTTATRGTPPPPPSATTRPPASPTGATRPRGAVPPTGATPQAGATGTASPRAPIRATAANTAAAPPTAPRANPPTQTRGVVPDPRTIPTPANKADKPDPRQPAATRPTDGPAVDRTTSDRPRRGRPARPLENSRQRPPERSAPRGDLPGQRRPIDDRPPAPGSRPPRSPGPRDNHSRRPAYYRDEPRPRRRMAPPPGASGNGRFLGQPRRVAAPITTAPEGSAWGPLLFGILLLGAVGWFAIKQYTPQIQEDLLRRSGDALDTAGYGDQAKVSIDGRNIVLEGNVATEADSENAVAAVAGTFGVRAVDNRLTVGEVTSVEPEVRNTPSLSVSKDGDAVVLSGTVSDQKFADAIKSSAIEQFGEGNVSGDVSVDETATNPGWMSAVSQVLPDLATIENGALSVDTDTLSLTGNAADEATKKAIGDKAASLLNGQLIVDNQIVAPEPAPEPEPAPAPAPVLPAFASVTETADQITLSGFLTQQNADAIASAYEEQGKPVINNITIDERADSPAWVNTFGQSDAALENVKDGRLTIARSGNVTVRGKVESDDLKASAGQQLAALFGPEHKIINALIVEPPPVVPTMTPFVAVTDNGDSLTLSGLLPENAAKTLLQSYRSGGSTVVDNIATDPRVMSPDWTENMGQALDSMTDIADAKLNIASSGELTARGLAQSEDAKQAAGTKLSALFGDSVSLRNEITVETPKIVEAPKPALSDVLARIDIAGIRFRSNSVELNGESIAILDQVANVLNDYESASIEIAGHTDSTGSPEYNLDLSANRATAVMQYLGTRGIAADRMSAKGYGPARPIATNDTSTGRAQNRRIEFTLTGE